MKKPIFSPVGWRRRPLTLSSHFRRISNALGAFYLAVLLAHPPARFAQSSSSEQALRARVQQLYAALQADDWTKVESFLTDDSKDIFRQGPKRGVQGFEIQSVKLDPDGQTAVVTAEIPVTSPNSQGPLSVLKTTRWRLIDSVWYAELPKPDPNELRSMYNAPPKKAFSAVPLALSKDLKFESTWAGIGFIHAGDVKLARFSFTNVSKHVVTLQETQAASDCLLVKSKQREFKPGEHAVLEVQFDSSCLGSIGVEQGLTQTLLLKTEPGGGYVNLTLSGRLVPGEASPPKSQ